MANTPHASMTGSEIHEPKGADTAPLGTVYVANGAGSGSWSSIGTSAFTGMVADFAAPVAPIGWLELDGSIISTATYPGLYAVMSITTSGTRSNGSAIVTSIPDTSNLRVGYYVFGTGISSGTTILSIDSATQITLSGNAASSGSSAFAVSPWLMNTGTIQLPDLVTNGRFRRSRQSGTKVGDVQNNQSENHTHSLSVTGVTGSDGNHGHVATVNDPQHSHNFNNTPVITGSQTATPQGGGSFTSPSNTQTTTLGPSPTGITVSIGASGTHTHSVSATGTSGNPTNGGTENRPHAVVFITCVKT